MATTVRPLRVEYRHRSPTSESDEDRMHRLVTDYASMLILNVPRADRAAATQRLQDFKRRGKHASGLLADITSVAAKARRPDLQRGLELIVRAEVTRKSPPLRLVADDVLVAENATNPALDDAVRRWAVQPTEANRRSAVLAAEAQLAATQLVLDLLNASPRGAA